MAKYRVYASQIVFYDKVVEANSIDEANEDCLGITRHSVGGMPVG